MRLASRLLNTEIITFTIQNSVNVDPSLLLPLLIKYCTFFRVWKIYNSKLYLHTVQTLLKEREAKLKLDADLSEAQRTIQVLTVDYKDAKQKLERLEQDHEAVLTKV